ncbi:MAG: hypothetical protein KBS70_05780 [Bacteroidales bacterium]|nr:hypothetical protein [Candidatus Colicola equi]
MGVNPQTVHADSYTLKYFERSLYQRLAYFIKLNNIPQSWNKDYLLFHLFFAGYVGVIDAKGKNGENYGAIPQWGSLSGFGIYRQPTRLSVCNEFVNMPLLKIGEECEIIRMTNDYRGIWDIVQFYAVKLALASKVFDMNLVASRCSHIVTAKTKAAAKTLKAAEDRAQSGESLVIVDEATLCPDDPTNLSSPFQVLDYDVKAQYMGEQMLHDMRTIYNMFDTEVGIPNANLEKKERMSESEINANDGETYARAQHWVENINDCFKKVNKMFGLNLSAELRKGDYANDSDNNN